MVPWLIFTQKSISLDGTDWLEQDFQSNSTTTRLTKKCQQWNYEQEFNIAPGLPMPRENRPFNIENTREIQRLDLALQLSGIGTWEIDLQTEQLLFCGRAKSQLGLNVEDSTGLRDFLGQIHHSAKPLWEQLIEKAAIPALSPEFSFEFLSPTQPGQDSWLFCKGQYLADAGHNSRILGSLVDITAEVNRRSAAQQESQAVAKQASKEQAALESSQAKFRALIDQAPVATSLFVGEDMVVEMANEPMISMWGKDQSVIGKALGEAVPELVGQPFLDILRNILRTGIPYSSQNAAADLVVDGKLSTYYFNFTYKPIFDSEGQIYGIVDMAVDVTAQVLAQKALEESESKLRAVIASAPAALGLFVGRELVVELPNQAFIDLVGKGPDIGGKPLAEVMPELESQPFLQILDEVYTTGVTYQSYGTRMDILRDGVLTKRYYDITYSPVYDSEGKVYAILDIAIDVTDRVSVEKQIEASQLQLLALFEQSPVGIAMIHRDNLTFTMANPFYGVLVGREPKTIIGKPLLEALPEISGQGFDKLLQEVIDTGIPFLNKEQPVEIDFDGTLKTIYVDLAYHPQRDQNGNIIGVFVVATDLTKQVYTRKKIEETQMFLQGAIELAELGTYIVDLKTHELTLSDRLKDWFGLQQETSINLQQVSAAISKYDLPLVAEIVADIGRPGSNDRYDFEFTLDGESGMKRVLHAQGQLLYNENNEPGTMIGTVQDVTAQRQIKSMLEQQVHQRTQELESMNEEYISINEELSNANALLQQSNVNLQQFAYVASHDLQEPLRKIQSFSDRLIGRYKDQLGDGIEYLQRMQRSAKRMSELIEDLLAFSRITSSQAATKNISLNEVLIDTINDLEIAISESDAKISVQKLPVVKGDRTQFNQLFLNLLSNALKFKKPDISAEILVSSKMVTHAELPASVIVTRLSNQYHQIDVADNGIGFDQQYADRIFQLFQRLHGRNQYPGTGIGLAICERVAANHGGGISVKSKAGEGTTFSIFLPV